MLTWLPLWYNRVPGISSAIEQVVLTALAKEPQQRFASVQAFAIALEQACISPGTRKGIPVPQTGFQYISPELLSQSSQPTYITPPRQSSQPPMLHTPQLMQSSQPTYATPAAPS